MLFFRLTSLRTAFVVAFATWALPLQALAQVTNVLSNPGFESGSTGWTFYTNASGNYAVVQPGFEGNNAARLTITTTGNNMQFYQTGVTLKANTNYTLSFAAYSSNSVDLGVAVQKHTTPFTNYGLNQTVDLGTSWSIHTLTFTTTGFSGTANDIRFRFVLNGYASANTLYYIDNVMLYETPLTGDPPEITQNPLDQTVASGATATFSVQANGTLPLSYSWQRNGTPIIGATGASYTTPATTVSDNGASFRAIVSNLFGADTSEAATLTVLVLPPTVTQHPQNQSVAVGQTATFSTAASGTLPLTFQWQKNGVNIAGATNPSYTTPATSLGDNGAVYRCVVTNSAGSDTTVAAILTVNYLPPQITQHPQNRSVTVGQTATFTITATGSAPLTFQWQKNGSNISGATSSSYTTPSTVISDNGATYRCIVTNDSGSVTSNAAVLSVSEVPPPMTSLSPKPGDIYKEFTRIMSHTTKEWRVTDPNATNAGAQQFKPNSVMSFTINDTVGAIRAELIVDLFGAHTGTTNKRFRLNGKSWITIPELGAANGIPAGKFGQCYMQQNNPVISVPLSHLNQGTNTIEGTSGSQTCFNTNWGQWGWYSATVRVYYNSTKLHPTGSIVSPAPGAVLNENPVIAATATGGAGVNRVEFLAYYYGYDTDGDGIFQDYHQSYRRSKSDNILVASNHVGTAIGAPYQVTWNTEFIPDQTPGLVRLIARVRDNAGVWFVTNEVTGLTLQRDSVSVKMYRPASIPERFNVRTNRTTVNLSFQIPAGDNLANMLAAQMHVRTWNGNNGGATSGETHYVRVNNWTAPVFGEKDFHSYDIIPLPASALKSGTNTLTWFSNTVAHGIDVHWPGPAIIIRYSTVPPTPPAITSQPEPQSVTIGGTATFSVVATGSQPLTYQWQRNNVNITGATSPSYTTPSLTLSDNGATYRCIVTNTAGSVQSNSVAVTVQAVAPTIHMQPISQIIQVGKSAVFSVVATGTEPLNYQWRKNGTDIAGATSAWYTTPALTAGDDGAVYTCLVANQGGSVSTQDAIVSVIASVPPSSIVSDDFNTPLLNSNLWTFLNPGTPSTLTMEGTGTPDAVVSVNIPGGSAHDMWTAGPMSPRIMQPVNNTDFEVEIKFQHPLLNQNFVGQGMVVEQDLNNYIRFNFTGRATGTQVYAASFVNGTATARYQINIPNGNPLWMRVQRVGNTWTHRYSYDGSTWTTAGTFNHTMAVGRVGVYFSNSGSPVPAFTGKADYFFNTASPIVPEDGNTLPATIMTHPVSQSIPIGNSVTFSVAAFGTPPLSFQWLRNGEPITGATSSNYVISAVRASDNGAVFRCIVSNPGNPPVESNEATLTVIPHPSGIISDDFNTFGVLPYWTVTNPLNVPITKVGTNTQNAHLRISLPAGTAHDAWTTNNSAPRLLQPSANTDFELEAKFESNFSQQFQMQGIIVQQDPQNFLRFDLIQKTAVNVYAASFANGVPTTRIDAALAPGNPNPVYMRVQRQGNQWTQRYSYDGQTWTNGASFSHTLSVTSVGVWAGNAGTTPPAFTANFDYFFLTADPVIPEDGGTAIDTFPPVILNVAALPGASNLIVSWNTDEPSTGTVQYGLSPSYELGSVSHADLQTAHSLELTGLQPNTVYNFRITSADGFNNSTTTGNFAVATIVPTPPVFNIWSGRNQTFGTVGNPQPFANILGNVQDDNGLRSLTYTLNGGPPRILSIGPDKRRLQNRGDFNIDIPTSELQATNTVIITAVDSQFTPASDTVTVNYLAGNTWPRTYSVNWSNASSVESVGQIVDGKWAIQNGNLRTVEPGYDRLVGFGEMSWADYEITTSVVIHGLDSTGFASPSNGPGVGFLMRWPGHSDLPVNTAGMQPKSGFLPLGALMWYKWNNDYSERLRMIGNNLVPIAAGDPLKNLSFGVRYNFKAQVLTTPGVGGLYKMKVWQDGTPEPAEWDMSGQQGISDPQTGAVFLVAHHLDISFGNVSITPLEPLSNIVSDDFFIDTLNTSLWSLVDPLGGASVQILGGGTAEARAAISVPAGVKHEPWSPTNTAVRLMQPVNDANFEVEARFESQFNGQVQMHGILVENSATNYIRFDFSSSGTQTKIFAGTIANGTYTSRYNQNISTGLPEYMRVKRVGTQWTMSYSYDAVDWTQAVVFNHGIVVTGVGPFAGNAGTNPPAYTALVDYFFNTALPIIPEDGGVGGIAPTISVQPINTIVTAGDTASFTLSVIGTPPLQYQWQRNGVNIPGATSATLLFPTTSVLADNGATFRCVVTNGFGADTSATATLTVTPIPSTIVSDDFRDGTLNTDLWRFEDPVGDATLGFTGAGTQDALLTISVPAGTSHDIWTSGNLSPKILQAANDTDFEVETKFQSGISDVHQFHGIIAQKDRQNLVRFGFTTHATQNFTRLFAASFVNGTPTTQINLNILPKGVTPLWLRVRRVGNTWSVFWSQNGTTFNNGGSFNHTIVIDSVGIYAGNAGTTPPAYASLIDYFFNNASRIDPEDGIAPSITGQPANVTLVEGLRATFSVTATGTSLAYQWQKNGVNITGANSASYTTQPALMSDSGSVFRCVVSNMFGSVTSTPAILHVNPQVPLPWWNSAWNFRLPLEVNTSGHERFGAPLEVEVDFTSAFVTLGLTNATFDPNSIRVVERTNDFNILDTLVAFQFDPANNYNATTNAAGTLTLLVSGQGTRYYDVYFDTLGAGISPANIPVMVTATDTSSYQGQESFKIVTTGGTYYYHKRGAGFASFIDNEGNDWISYQPGGGSAGEFRGIPNLGDVFHPGYTNSNSFIENPGPIKTRIRSISTNGAWEAVWDIFPKFARMTLLKRGASYWFLYEGTPGGQFHLERDFVYRSTGVRTPASTSWTQDLPGEEWAYVGDTTMTRVMYLIHHEDDTQPDYYRHSDGNMTILGFGRKDPCCIRYLDAIPQTFTFGFAEDSTFSEARKIIRSAFRPMTVVQGYPQEQGSSGIPLLSTIVSDNFNAPSLNTNLWTYINPLGDASLGMTGNALMVLVPSGVSHDAWTGANNAPRIMQPANNANFEVEAKFLSSVSISYQIQGIIVQGSPGNYIRFDFVRGPSGTRAFAASFVNHVATVRIDTLIAAGSPIWLRVRRTGNIWRHQFSLNGTTWITSGTFSHIMEVTSIGPFFGNAGSPVPQFIGQVDYFYNVEVPIVPTLPTFGGNTPDEPTVAAVVPEEYFLKPNYPNPFNPSTTIQYGLPEPAQVHLKVYNMLGQLVATLADVHQGAGFYQVRWDGRNDDGQPVGSGMYIYRIVAINESGNVFTTHSKMMLVR